MTKKNVKSPPRRFGEVYEVDIGTPGLNVGPTYKLSLVIGPSDITANQAEKLLFNTSLKICLFCDPSKPDKGDADGQVLMDSAKEIFVLLSGMSKGYSRNEHGYKFSITIPEAQAAIDELERFKGKRGRIYIQKLTKVIADENAGDPDPE